jgi:hypothetical protein
MTTTTEIELPSAPVARVAEMITQATAIEQARAVAEVQAAIIVAQQCPRSMTAAVAAMRESCGQKALAERAFFRYSRAGSAITGPTINMARELARCFGNVQYGIAELSRDDAKGESQMTAFAWDVERNTRNSNTFVVPHARDTKDGRKPIVDLRDVYENNANMGARRLREAIFAILPTWFTEEAKDICTATLRDGGGKPLAQRIADAIKVFEGLGITVDQLEQKQGRASDKWTEHDVAALGVTYKSIQRGEITLDEEFPPQRVTVDEINGAPATSKPARGKAKVTDDGPSNEPTAAVIAAMNAEAAADPQNADSSLFGGDSK